jgi:Tol biopolymer transport system component/DNA-binding winged helix-turn-helix (wHTH) protein
MDADIRSIARRCYTFGPFAADCRKRLLWRDGKVVPLTPKAFEILATLIEHRGRVVDKDELLSQVWGDVAVEDATLARHISTLRRALDERPNQHLYVVTVPGRGYEFVSRIDEVDDAPPSMPVPVTHADSEPSHAVATASNPGVRWPLVLGTSLTLALAIAGLITLQSRRSQTRVSERGLRQVTFRGGLQRQASWSPDGQWIAYTSDVAGNSDIWIQKTSDSQAFRVSSSSFEDSQPDWSPDSHRIVFRSERSGGGIYVASVQGGNNDRRIADFGYHPKWSPGGSLILFSSSGHSGGATRLYLVGVDGGTPQLLRPDVLTDVQVVDAEWKPDGGVSIWGRRDGAGWSFVTVQVNGGAPISSNRSPAIDQLLGDNRLTLSRFIWSHSGRYVFFEGRSENVRNLWRITVDPSTQTWTSAERLTTGADPEGDMALSPDDTRLIFAAGSSRTRLWSYPFDAESSKILGAGSPMTSGAGSEQDAESPADGNKLVYSARRGGRQEFWERTLADGHERLLLSTTEWDLTRPRWSRDGLRLAYLRRRVNGTGRADYAVAVLSISGQERLLTEPGQVDLVPTDWSPDGAWLLGSCRTGTPVRLGACVLPVSDGSVSATALRVVAADPTKNIYESRFSPDQRWISFIAVDRADARVSRVYVVSASGGSWHPLTAGRWYDDKPHWSRDSRTLYFLSDRNGLFNLWAQRFDPDTGTTIGDPFQVTSFDTPHETISTELTRCQIAITSTHVFLPITESAGELWMLDHVDR